MTPPLAQHRHDRRGRIAVVLLAAASVLTLDVSTAARAFAQEGEEAVRYQLRRVDGGFARVDTTTGEVSSCIFEGDQLVCRMAADERSALMTKIEELETRIARIEAGSGSASGIPSDDEIDRALGAMEKFMYGFSGIVRGFEGSPL